MTAYVALFRGINVGGRNSLPMQELHDLLGELGCTDVHTYIQSGNAVFRSTRKAAALSRAIGTETDKRFGFRPAVLLLRVAEFESIAAANPYVNDEANPAHLHLWFLAATPKNPDLSSLEAVRAESEAFELGAGALYLRAPAGIGRSKLAARVERALGVDVTARNWRTVSKLSELASTIVC
jgi:uncharacterized protein (DUF1697 family)